MKKVLDTELNKALGDCLEACESNPVLIEQDGNPRAVLVSHEMYEYFVEMEETMTELMGMLVLDSLADEAPKGKTGKAKVAGKKAIARKAPAKKTAVKKAKPAAKKPAAKAKKVVAVKKKPVVKKATPKKKR